MPRACLTVTSNYTISAEPGYNYDIQASTNLSAWTTIATLPNPTGVIQFTDPDAAHYTSRMYRAARGLIAPPSWTLNSVSRQGNQFSFSINGPTGQVVRVESSTNLVNWAMISTLTNLTGIVQFSDPSASNINRFYRAASPQGIILAILYLMVVEPS